MDDNDLISMGCVIGMVVALALTYTAWDIKYGSQLDKCEAELPRNQECILVAIPKSIK